jgi:hypothetical protein
MSSFPQRIWAPPSISWQTASPTFSSFGRTLRAYPVTKPRSIFVRDAVDFPCSCSLACPMTIGSSTGNHFAESSFSRSHSVLRSFSTKSPRCLPRCTRKQPQNLGSSRTRQHGIAKEVTAQGNAIFLALKLAHGFRRRFCHTFEGDARAHSSGCGFQPEGVGDHRCMERGM